MDNTVTNPLNDFLIKDYKEWGKNKYLSHNNNGIFQSRTFEEFIEEANYLGQYLIDCGYRDKNIGIFSPNSIYIFPLLFHCFLVQPNISITCNLHYCFL